MASSESNPPNQSDPTIDGFKLSGVAIVTGAGSGIGREAVLTFARSGVRAVTLADINLDAAKQVAEESKAIATNPQYETLPLAVDIANDEAVEDMVRQTVEKYGRIDYGVNSAGIAYKTRHPITDFDANELLLMHDVHVKGTLNFMKYVIRAMEKQEYIKTASRGRNGVRYIGRGAIVNLTSLAGVIGVKDVVQYATAKAAVRWATKAAALEVGEKGIRVNCVAPAGVDGPMTDDLKSMMPDWKAVNEKRTPLRRLAEIEEVTDAVVFLCSPLSSYLHGITLNVDGGLSLSAD